MCCWFEYGLVSLVLVLMLVLVKVGLYSYVLMLWSFAVFDFVMDDVAV